MKPWDYTKRVIKVATFIARKSIRRGSIMAKFTMVFILMLTFLNLTVVGGLLNGIIVDIGQNINKNYVGDVFIEPLSEENQIQDMNELRPYLNSDKIKSYSKRLTKTATIEYDYKTVTQGKEPPQTETIIAGLHPDAERKVTSLADNIIAGNFLKNKDVDGIVLGSDLVDGYTVSSVSSSDNLGHVSIGEKVKVHITNGNTYEFKVVGISNTKTSTMDGRSFVNYKTLKQLSELPDNRYSEIAVRAQNPKQVPSLVNYLREVNERMGNQNKIEKLEEAIPSALTDLKLAFGLIANIVGATAILVGLVIVFVIIFINASNRRRELGILKAQGIEPSALILSYIFQALFYTIVGVIIALGILFFFLQNYFANNPISLPMADGQLVLGTDYLSLRAGILIISAIISGFIPSWLIVRQNTLDSILGR